MVASKHRHTHTVPQCSPASVGLTQAHPNNPIPKQHTRAFFTLVPRLFLVEKTGNQPGENRKSAWVGG